MAAKRQVWIAALAAAGLAVFYGGLFRRNAPIRSVAVLPLGEGYLAAGLAGELTGALARIHGWRVISSNSAMRDKTGRSLGVDALLKGSIQQTNGRVRADLRLVRGEDSVWTQSYDRELRDLPDLGNEVARAIAQKTGLPLTADEQQRLGARHPVNPDAYQLYLQGRAEDPSMEEGILKAIRGYEQAIQKDPAYAPAHAALSMSYALLNPGFRPPKQVMPQAREHAVRAIELDDTLADAHLALADVMLRYDWDWAGAEREIRRAIELNPNSADAHAMYGNYFAAAGEFPKAIAESTLAHELDPLSLGTYSGLIWNLVIAREYDRAIAESRRAIEAHPDFAPGHAALGMTYVLTGKLPEALEEARLADKLQPDPLTQHFVAMVYAAAGNKADAQRLAAALEKAADARYGCAYEIASIHLVLGDKDKADSWLQRGMREQADCMIWLKTEPWMEPARQDARFADLIRRVNFPATVTR